MRSPIRTRTLVAAVGLFLDVVAPGVTWADASPAEPTMRP